MDGRSDTAPENENNKKRISSEEAEDFQHNSKRNCPIGSEDVIAAPKNEDSDEEMLSIIESYARHIVSKGAGKKLLPMLYSLLSPIREQHESGKEVSSEIIGCGSSGAPKYVLCFYNEIAENVYANKEIKSVNGDPLKVTICDSANLNVPVSTEKLSSAPVELFLEDGEHKEISKSDKGKPLMFGDLQFNLQNGIGEVKHLTVTDSSYRSMSKKFYLGVRIMDEKILAEFGVNEKAVSRGFRVYCERMKGKERHHPPNWDDATYRLHGIGDKYASLLSSRQPHPINTVGDFLVAHDYGRGAISLKQHLGMTSNADDKWYKIVNHAMECEDPRAANYVLHFNQTNDPNYWNENFGGDDDHDEQNQIVNDDQNLEFNYQQNQNQNDVFHEDLGFSSISAGVE